MQVEAVSRDRRHGVVVSVLVFFVNFLGERSNFHKL